MTRFEEVMEVVFKWEGGYVDHPNDPGGATNMGVTHKVLAKWRGVSAVSKEEVKKLTTEEAREIFEHKYFKPIRGELLPAPIDLIMMDGAVNHGVTTMVRMFEKALNFSLNGRMSVANIDAMKKVLVDDKALVKLTVLLAEARKERYLTRPHSSSFILGWTNRLNDVLAVALEPFSEGWTFSTGMTSDGSTNRVESETLSTIVRPVIEDEDLQAAMTSWGDYTGEIDGVFGPNSLAAAINALSRNSAVVSGDWRTWSTARKKIAIGQLISRELNLDIGRIDGLFGPVTEAAFIAFNRIRLKLPDDNWRDELERVEKLIWSPISPKSSRWPKESEIEGFYGKPCTNGGVKLTRLELPFDMKIAWDLGTVIDGFSINENVRDSASRVFDKIYEEYGDDGVEDLGINLFGGCYNCRKIRGGTRWSTHAWAIAIDFDPARNRLKWDHKLARLARPDAISFWEFWESEGWFSLGRARDYDWMHIQAAIR